MRIRFHNRAIKALEKLDEKDKERVRIKPNQSTIPHTFSFHAAARQ
jgi:hypothetical protein